MSRIMALDLGEVTIGVALSDPMKLTARPLLTLRRGGLKTDLREIRQLVSEHEVEAIVVGLPLRLSGEAGTAATEALQFCDVLGRSVDVPVHTWDERFSTVQAERALLEANMRRSRRREVINHVAAAILLQSWLDARGAAPS